MISAYFLGHGLWTVIPHQLEENFKDMVDCGYTDVAISFSESEMRYARRAFELMIKLAKKQGLKCLVIPSRLGGRFAGAPLMPNVWLSMNPQYSIPSPGWMPVGCLESKEFREWAIEFMDILVKDYDIDGIIWDEPKSAGVISKHPDTIAKYGKEPTTEQMQDSFVEFIEMLTGHCLAVKPHLSFTLFAQITDPEYFTSKAAGIKGVEYFGYDGSLSSQSFFHEEPSFGEKYPLGSVWDWTLKECKNAGKKTFALVENILMPDTSIPMYEENFETYLKTYKPDHLSIYYYGHNNEDPEAVHKITKKLMKKYLR